MSNIKSVAGASVWMLVSTLLMFAALEPVPVQGNGAEAQPAAFAQGNASAAAPRA